MYQVYFCAHKYMYMYTRCNVHTGICYMYVHTQYDVINSLWTTKAYYYVSKVFHVNMLYVHHALISPGPSSWLRWL